METISPQDRLDFLPFQPAHIHADSDKTAIRVEDYQNLPPSDLTLPPMDYHIIAFHYKPPQGLLRHRCGGQWQEAHMRLGDITYVPAHMDNQWQFDGNHPHCLHVLVADEFIKQIAGQTWQLDPASIHFRPQFHQRNITLKRIIFQLHQMILSKVEVENFQIERLGVELSTHLLANDSNKDINLEIGYKLSQNEFDALSTYILEHLHTPIKLNDLATHLNLSMFHFSRMFRNTTGTSPYEYLIQLRIEEAAELLLKSNKLPISEIAHRIGFSDQSHFTRHFKKRFGLTPLAFRRMYSY
ncbi:MAG: helix-turn-helix transcriptional regulator [Chloroflexota bacterium]